MYNQYFPINCSRAEIKGYNVLREFEEFSHYYFFLIYFQFMLLLILHAYILKLLVTTFHFFSLYLLVGMLRNT